MIDLEALEAESEALRERSAELVRLLDEAAPIVDRTPIYEVKQEARALAAAAHAARQVVAEKIAANVTPGTPVGRQPLVHRVRTDSKGKDLDPLHGRPVITPELIASVEHQRYVVGPAIEGVYRQAVLDRPWRAALVAAVRGQLELLRVRQSFKIEGGEELAASLIRYEAAFSAVAAGINDGQTVTTEATARLANLERVRAEATIGDDGSTSITGLIAAAVAGAMPDDIVFVDGAGLPSVVR